MKYSQKKKPEQVGEEVWRAQDGYGGEDLVLHIILCLLLIRRYFWMLVSDLFLNFDSRTFILFQTYSYHVYIRTHDDETFDYELIVVMGFQLIYIWISVVDLP